MCTAVLSIEPGLPVLLVGVRDELTDRAWDPPGPHWPQYPGLLGGKDHQAGGTWLAVSAQDRRVACVLNGVGQPAPLASRLSRGVLPLRAAAGQPLDRSALASLDPFRLLTAEPGRAILQAWDGQEFTERELPAGLHLVVNSGLAGDLTSAGQPAEAGLPISARRPSATGQAPNGREHEVARIAHFLRRFADAARPEPRPGLPVREAWGEWLPLVNGDGIGPHDARALIVRRDFADGRSWGTTSISLVALAPGEVRYDFSGSPGDRDGWRPVV